MFALFYLLLESFICFLQFRGQRYDPPVGFLQFFFQQPDRRTRLLQSKSRVLYRLDIF